MPFSIRLHRRFPVQCAVTYHAGLFQGQGTVWNFSLSGWKLSGDVPLQVGQTCSLTAHLLIEENTVVDAEITRCPGPGVCRETLVVKTHSRLEHLIKQLAQESVESIP